MFSYFDNFSDLIPDNAPLLAWCWSVFADRFGAFSSQLMLFLNLFWSLFLNLNIQVACAEPRHWSQDWMSTSISSSRRGCIGSSGYPRQRSLGGFTPAPWQWLCCLNLHRFVCVHVCVCVHACVCVCNWVCGGEGFLAAGFEWLCYLVWAWFHSCVVRKYVVDAMFYYTVSFMADYLISAMD